MHTYIHYTVYTHTTTHQLLLIVLEAPREERGDGVGHYQLRDPRAGQTQYVQ